MLGIQVINNASLDPLPSIYLSSLPHTDTQPVSHPSTLDLKLTLTSLEMPSFSKLLLLATLSLPVAEPANIGVNVIPGIGLARAAKRQGSRSIQTAEPGSVEKREAEAEAEPGNGFHTGGQFGGGITRGSKREAEPGNGFHSGGQFGGGITRGS